MSINRTGTSQIRTTTGAIVQYGGSSAPSGWVICDGTAYDVTTAPYLALWSVIGTTYGGTGQSDFKVPDLRGRVAIGSGTGTASGATAKTLGSTPTSGAGGEETHLLTGAESGTSVHSHNIT